MKYEASHREGHKSKAFLAANFESKVILEPRLKRTASLKAECWPKGGKGQRLKGRGQKNEIRTRCRTAGIVMRPCPLSTLWQQI